MPTMTFCQVLEPGMTDAQITQRITELKTLGGALEAYVQVDGPTRYLYTVREVVEGPPTPTADQRTMSAHLSYLQGQLASHQATLVQQRAYGNVDLAWYYQGQVDALTAAIRWLYQAITASRP